MHAASIRPALYARAIRQRKQRERGNCRRAWRKASESFRCAPGPRLRRSTHFAPELQRPTIPGLECHPPERHSEHPGALHIENAFQVPVRLSPQIHAVPPHLTAQTGPEPQVAEQAEVASARDQRRRGHALGWSPRHDGNASAGLSYALALQPALARIRRVLEGVEASNYVERSHRQRAASSRSLSPNCPIRHALASDSQQRLRSVEPGNARAARCSHLRSHPCAAAGIERSRARPNHSRSSAASYTGSALILLQRRPNRLARAPQSTPFTSAVGLRVRLAF